MITPDVDAAFHRLVGALAGPEPLPAGGAAGVTALAMGVAVATKAIRLSARGPSELDAVGDRLDRILERVLPQFAADCAAFSGLLAAWRRPHDDARRADAIRGAWHDATVAPVAVATVAHEAEALLAGCQGRIKPSVAGDLAAALELVRAGRRIAASNARENARHLAPEVAAQLLDPLDRPPEH